MDIVDALRQPCLVDTSLLTNFLFSGNALLLNQLIGQPMQITPAILDAAEVDLIDPTRQLVLRKSSARCLLPKKNRSDTKRHGLIF